ncbi:MAG: isocitrate lyase/phosphoenolpyruvate mutase family protein [Gammaproteobacteria bacterium]|nr:isocitrate lyase/phosphoenolpyruvate mutase family protein [Gammaproteobacteria bacterium]
MRFRRLHDADDVFLMPNAWDPGSARLLADFGFSALATTSAGIAFSLGRPDYAAAVSRDRMLDCVRAIAAAVDLPVNADLEAGYGREPDMVAETITLAASAGVVGGNIEDHGDEPETPLFDLELAAERIVAAREAADATGIPFTLTARSDTFLNDVDDPLNEAIRRCNRYREAGADCLFVPGPVDPESIATLVREIDGPLNVVMGLAETTLDVDTLRRLGVRRISIGGSLARAVYGFIRNAARELSQTGTFRYAEGQIPDAELCRFFAGNRRLASD